MKKNKVKILEGDVFGVPLEQGGHSVGLIAKTYKTIALGYFFNIVFSTLPEKVESWVFDMQRVIFIGKFIPIGIENGEWPKISTDLIFNTSDWPIPIFKMQEPLTEQNYSVQYDETLLYEKRELITEYEASKLFGHGLHGYGVMQKIISTTLAKKE